MHRVRDETEIYSNYLTSEFDELNSIFYEYRGKEITDDLISDVIQYVIFMYLNGYQSVSYMVGVDGTREPNTKTISKAIYTIIDGKDIYDRLSEIKGKKYDDLQGQIENIIRSDGHRCYVSGQMQCAKNIKSKGVRLSKTWDSVMDGKERITHHNLHGVEKEEDEYFETVNGKTKAPGQFGIPEEDCNCRCILKYRRL